MAGGSGRSAEVRVRLVADPVSVPAARRFVRDALSSWQLAELVDDASLCVSELTSNAALHSASPYFDVVLDEAGGSVRISVDDEGLVPAAAVAPRASDSAVAVAAATGVEAVSSTGRGLVIVSAIASDWGVEETDGGKRVWARIAYADDERIVGPPVTATLPEPSEATAGLPAGWHVVRLAGCPVDLSLRQDQQLDELVRELQLVSTADAAAPSRALARVIDGVLQGQAHARHMGRRIALDAAAAGLELIDVDMPVPFEAARDVQQMHRAVKEADALCARAQLLTLASPPEIMRLREWMAQEFDRQVEHGRPPTTYARWLRDR